MSLYLKFFVLPKKKSPSVRALGPKNGSDFEMLYLNEENELEAQIFTVDSIFAALQHRLVCLEKLCVETQSHTFNFFQRIYSFLCIYFYFLCIYSTPSPSAPSSYQCAPSRSNSRSPATSPRAQFSRSPSPERDQLHNDDQSSSSHQNNSNSNNNTNNNSVVDDCQGFIMNQLYQVCVQFDPNFNTDVSRQSLLDFIRSKLITI